VVADFGCGAGASTGVLAEALDGPIHAVDACGPYLDELWDLLGRRGLQDRLLLHCADLAEPGFPTGSLDLIWSEGAIYLLGFGAGLRRWRPLLRPGGCLAVTEMTWLSPEPPLPAREAWQAWYPDMGTLDHNLRTARDAGFEVLGTFPLPPEDMTLYLQTTSARAQAFAGQSGFEGVVAEVEAECRLYAAHGSSYGYVAYALQRPLEASAS